MKISKSCTTFRPEITGQGGAEIDESVIVFHILSKTQRFSHFKTRKWPKQSFWMGGVKIDQFF